ncbi:hypothetical protein [Nostoc sp. FACHB-888]|uniref:hypothetical protein n=1 Tax=Nostoc sp. FACHB-888 TaxID=2692842 RepID=UPI001687D372|nr:hypothetical protein [Nostoc sp. FACHB-888]MBD2247024.1 hypothetical protein [Nostoc sp. FACHB-888]
MNLSIASPTGLTINESEKVFVSGATSNRSTVVATNSLSRGNTNDLLLGDQDNDTFVSNLGTDALTRGADGSLFIGTTTSTSEPTNVMTDLNASLGNGIGIVENNNLLNNFTFTGLNSIGDDQFQNSLL